MTTVDRAAGASSEARPPAPARPPVGPGADAHALAGRRFLLSFDGTEPTPQVLDAIRAGRTSGVTLFRPKNVVSPAQVRELCAALQAARPAGDPALVVGLDQEGGQLQAVGFGATAWPGNLALGATGSEDLARRAGLAIGREAAAMGATMVYAPVCDVLHRSSATMLGTRAFGSDPALVGRLAAAMTRGLAEAGVATTIKHFPGHGRAAGDSHLAMPVVTQSREELEAEELVPFRAGIAAGAVGVLVGHVGLPAIVPGDLVPATVARSVLEGLLRADLGFAGVTVSDALDMGGAAMEGGLDAVVVAAANAGMDLLLTLHAPEIELEAFDALVRAIESGSADAERLVASRDRILRLRDGLPASPAEALDVVGSAEHAALAREIAEASVTLVAGPDRAVPFVPLASGARVAVVAPVPVDLTPAETSSYVRLGLAGALRARGLVVDEFVAPLDPTPAQAAALAFATAGHDAVIVCTFDAIEHPGQAEIAGAVAAETATGRGRGRAVAVALRSPYDAALVPEGVPAVCTYGIQEPQTDALAAALTGQIPFRGTLPVDLEEAR